MKTSLCLLAVAFSSAQALFGPDFPFGSRGFPKIKVNVPKIDVSDAVSGDNVLHISGSGSHSVSRNCINNKCNVCINYKCYGDIPIKSVRSGGNCPLAVCEKNCYGFHVFTDNCPMCRCDGYATRGLCKRHSDCGPNSQGCFGNVCRYGAISADLPLVCTFHHECPATDECRPEGYCVPSPTGRVHVEGRQCVFDYSCPSTYECQNMSCFAGGGEHLENQCVLPGSCPAGYYCKSSKMTCYKN